MHTRLLRCAVPTQTMLGCPSFLLLIALTWADHRGKHAPCCAAAVTLGVLSPAEDCSPEERAALREVHPMLCAACAAAPYLLCAFAESVPAFALVFYAGLLNLCPPPSLSCYSPIVLQLIAVYTERGRTGVAAPSRDVEAYLLPPCSIAERLLSAARAAAGPQVRMVPAAGLPSALLQEGWLAQQGSAAARCLPALQRTRHCKDR